MDFNDCEVWWLENSTDVDTRAVCAIGDLHWKRTWDLGGVEVELKELARAFTFGPDHMRLPHHLRQRIAEFVGYIPKDHRMSEMPLSPRVLDITSSEWSADTLRLHFVRGNAMKAPPTSS